MSVPSCENLHTIAFVPLHHDLFRTIKRDPRYAYERTLRSGSDRAQVVVPRIPRAISRQCQDTRVLQMESGNLCS